MSVADQVSGDASKLMPAPDGLTGSGGESENEDGDETGPMHGSEDDDSLKPQDDGDDGNSVYVHNDERKDDQLSVIETVTRTHVDFVHPSSTRNSKQAMFRLHQSWRRCSLNIA